MMRLTDAGSVVQAAVALGLALIAAPIVRGLTSELDNTVGRAWPFSMARCSSGATPGCHDIPMQSSGDRAAVHIRTGHL